MKNFTGEVFYRVTVPEAPGQPPFCAGVWATESRGRIFEAAPILRWSLNMTVERLEAWVARKGGTMERVER